MFFDKKNVIINKIENIPSIKSGFIIALFIIYYSLFFNISISDDFLVGNENNFVKYILINSSSNNN